MESCIPHNLGSRDNGKFHLGMEGWDQQGTKGGNYETRMRSNVLELWKCPGIVSVGTEKSRRAGSCSMRENTEELQFIPRP